MEDNFTGKQQNELSFPTNKGEELVHTPQHGKQAEWCSDAQVLEQSEIVLKQLVSGIKFLHNNKWRLAL